MNMKMYEEDKVEKALYALIVVVVAIIFGLAYVQTLLECFGIRF